MINLIGKLGSHLYISVFEIRQCVLNLGLTMKQIMAFNLIQMKQDKHSQFCNSQSECRLEQPMLGVVSVKGQGSTSNVMQI